MACQEMRLLAPRLRAPTGKNRFGRLQATVDWFTVEKYWTTPIHPGGGRIGKKLTAADVSLGPRQGPKLRLAIVADEACVDVHQRCPADRYAASAVAAAGESDQADLHVAVEGVDTVALESLDRKVFDRNPLPTR